MSERFEVRVEAGFRARHRRAADGTETDLHEHDWRVAVHARSGQLDEIAIVVDFRLLRDVTEKLLEELADTELESHSELAGHPVTALRVGEWILDRLGGLGEGESWEIHAVEVECDPGIRYRVER